MNENTNQARLNNAGNNLPAGQYAVKISEREARGLLNGKLHGGSKFPVFPFGEFKRGVADLPIRYGVVMDFELAKKANSGYESFDILMHDPIMIVRAGGVKPLAAYLDKARARHNTKSMGNAHSHNDIDPNQPQTRLLKLAGNKGGVGSEGKELGLGWGYDADYGMDSDWPGGLARYVAVTPRKVSTNLRHLDFET